MRNNITNAEITEYINSFYRPLNEDLAYLRLLSEKNNIPLILRETESFLKTFLDILQPKKILEIGTAFGYSSAFFSVLLPESQIVSIEKSEYMYETAIENLNRAGLSDRIKLVNSDATYEMNNLITKGAEFDFIFIDASKSHYREFFDAAERLCHDGTVIICDNVLLKASIADNKYDNNRRHRTNISRMKNFLEYINERNNLSAATISCGDGLTIIKYNEKQ